ncbi:hypothetical protein [Singulisphaera sp. PoT]|uniref:hypothetical protein n=1 Tax=Singulisphaera sp. PoT TaxID=3411797 RepID=UPI003BF48401
MMYDTAHWYWIVDGDATRAWSGASRTYVPVADEGYAAWLAAGGVPTRISAEDLPGVVNRPVIDQLAMLDIASARAIRSITIALQSGQGPSEGDIDALKSHDAAARALRETLV